MFAASAVFEPDRGFSTQESEALGAETRNAHLRDRELSDRLGGPELQGAVASSGSLHELGRRGRLPDALERTLVAEAKGGDRRARAQLVEAFLPAIAAVARVYRGRGQIERAELMQEGVVGLLRALERYDPDRGVPFWSYAAWWVRQAMQQLIAELARPVVLSDHALRQLADLREVHAAHLRRHGREPTAQEMASASGIDRETWTTCSPPSGRRGRSRRRRAVARTKASAHSASCSAIRSRKTNTSAWSRRSRRKGCAAS